MWSWRIGWRWISTDLLSRIITLWWTAIQLRLLGTCIGISSITIRVAAVLIISLCYISAEVLCAVVSLVVVVVLCVICG